MKTLTSLSREDQTKMSNTIESNGNPKIEVTDANDATDNSGGSILGHIWASIGVTLVLGVDLLRAYPLPVWAIGQAVFPIQANGSLVTKDGKFTSDDKQAVGSYLIGQNFSAAGYFIRDPVRQATVTTPAVPAAVISVP